MADLDADALAEAVRETGIALRPGDVLAVRLPMSANRHEMARADEYGRGIEAKTGIKVLFIPGEEFAHSTVNVTVNFTGDSAAAVGEIRETVKRAMQRRRNGEGPFPLAG